MADEAPHEVAPSPDGSAKKELTMDQLKTYVHKARAKIRRLEEYNQSLSTKVGELEGAQQSASASANGADQGERACLPLSRVSLFFKTCAKKRGISGLRRAFVRICLQCLCCFCFPACNASTKKLISH